MRWSERRSVDEERERAHQHHRDDDDQDLRVGHVRGVKTVRAKQIHATGHQRLNRLQASTLRDLHGVLQKNGNAD
jgi:hypothetical protein